MKTILFIIIIKIYLTYGCFYTKKVTDGSNPTFKLCQSQRDCHFTNSIFVDPSSYQFSCVDGRSTRDGLSTLGGDSGEFLLGIATFQNLTGESDECIIARMDDFFHDFIDFQPTPIYLHTDDHATEIAQNVIREKLKDPKLIVNFKNPDPSYREYLISLLSDKKYVGCGHIRLMMENPDQYHISTKVVSEYLRLFFNELWQPGHASRKPRDVEYVKSSKVYNNEFIDLHGVHQEKSSIIIDFPNLGEKCNGNVLTVNPNPFNCNSSAFIFHSNSVLERGVRGRIMKYFTNINPRIDIKKFTNMLNTINNQWQHLSISKLAPTLPVDKVDITLYDSAKDVPSSPLKDLKLLNCEDIGKSRIRIN